MEENLRETSSLLNAFEVQSSKSPNFPCRIPRSGLEVQYDVV